jgi:prepilin-type N-terminal cleavage/methylation domain-containing protein
MRRSPSAQNGFTLVELLVVFIVIGVLTAIAFPMYAGQRARAKLASLKESTRVMVVETTTRFADAALSRTYAQSAGTATSSAQVTAAKRYVSNALESALENGAEGSNGDGVVNPYSRKKTVLNLSNASLSAANATPAVFITSAAGCRYASFQTQSVTVRNNLKGTVIACWNTLAAVNAIEIYYVDRSGVKAPAVTLVSLAQ